MAIESIHTSIHIYTHIHIHIIIITMHRLKRHCRCVFYSPSLHRVLSSTERDVLKIPHASIFMQILGLIVI